MHDIKRNVFDKVVNLIQQFPAVAILGGCEFMITINAIIFPYSSFHMAEAKNTRGLPKPEGIEENYVEYTRYDDSKKWVTDNETQFRNLLLAHRSLWQKLVDWAHRRPLPALLLALSLLILLVSAVLLSVFFAGMPMLFMAVGLTIAITLPLFTSLL